MADVEIRPGDKVRFRSHVGATFDLTVGSFTVTVEHGKDGILQLKGAQSIPQKDALPNIEASTCEEKLSAEDERAALIWALHFFGLFAQDCDGFKDPPRGAWMWSQQFEYKENTAGEYEVDTEPAITERLDDDLYLLGINHEFTGGCYSYGLPMKLFRRAAEVLTLTGTIQQYTDEQKARFQEWLWHGGAVPRLAGPD